MEYKEETFESINDWVELEEDKEYNRYVSKSLTGIDTSIIRKILYFKNEGIYIIYTKETIMEAIYKWQMKHKRENI